MKNWKAILAVAVIFGAGLVTGAVVTGSQMRTELATPPPPPMPGGPPGMGRWAPSRDQFVQRVNRQCGLSTEQSGEVDRIMKESHERMAKLWEPIAPQAREETRKVREQIQGLLTPEQKAKFEAGFRPRRAREQSVNWKDRKERESSSVKECSHCSW